MKKIKVLGISGSPIKDGNTDIALSRGLELARSFPRVETEMIALSNRRISDCQHCNWCLRGQREGKPCVQEDDMREIYPKVLEADALLLATPVYVARLSGYMAGFLDRLRAFVHGNIYKGKLREKVGAAIAVGWFRHGGIETALLTIIYGFMTYQMIPVGTSIGCPWGAPLLASKDGTGAFHKERRHGVMEDAFGMRALETLVERMVTICKRLKGVPSEETV